MRENIQVKHSLDLTIFFIKLKYSIDRKKINLKIFLVFKELVLKKCLNLNKNTKYYYVDNQLIYRDPKYFLKFISILIFKIIEIKSKQQSIHIIRELQQR